MQNDSPSKRIKMSPSAAGTVDAVAPVAAVAGAAVTSEPALLQHVLGFLPLSSLEDDTTSSVTPTVVLQTIVALCRAIPGLSQHVGPANEAFWRAMVLAHFDFTTDDTSFNVDDWDGDYGDYRDAVDDPSDDSEQLAHWHRHPTNGPLDEWARAHPDEDAPDQFLVNDLHFWPSLKTYFKPTAYGFLVAIQADRLQLAALWPDHEDAFSLFCDLLLLPRFQSTEETRWTTWFQGEVVAHPCFMGRFPTKIVGRGFAMLQFCDIAPYFWDDSGKAVSARWSGFDGEPPVIKCEWAAQQSLKRAAWEQRRREAAQKELGEEEEDDEGDDDDFDHDGCEQRSEEEDAIFPDCSATSNHSFSHLRRFVYETFSDWRLVCVGIMYTANPEFYMGPTKRSGRWMGFVGQSAYG